MEIIHFHNNTSKHKQFFFSIFKIFIKNDDISFKKYLKYLKFGENTYILSFKIKLTELYIFLKWTPKNIKNNAFNIFVIHLWFANTNIQFILDPYASITYCTSYMTKINKSITS